MTFDILKDKKVGLVRADSGFYAHDFLNYLEHDKKTNYIIAVKMYSTIKQELRSRNEWTKLKDGIEGQNALLMKLMELLNGSVHDSGCFIFTTNFIDKINSALFRDGRINLKLKISGLYEFTAYNKFFTNIYNDSNWTTHFTEKELIKLYSKEIPLCKLSEIAKINLYNEENFISTIKNI